MNNCKRNTASPYTIRKNGSNMKELPSSEQPYEKCLMYGAGSLSDAELLSVVIRTGSPGEKAVDLSRRILSSLPEGCLGGMFRVSIEELQEIHGVGKVKAIQLKCIAEFSRRVMRSTMPPTDLVCTQPEKVAAYFMQQMRFLETEQVRLLILNGKNMLMRDIMVSNGSFNASFASPREIFYYALKHKAVHIILLHNHPSGDPTPSREDIILTKRLADSGKMIGISLIDHIIIGDNQFISFKQSGYLSDSL